MQIAIPVLAALPLACPIMARAQLRPEIPKAWSADALAAMTQTPAGTQTRAGVKSTYPPADWYYRIPERVIYRTYPVYKPDAEPQNYLNFLSAQAPEVVFDAGKLNTEGDWLRAGEAVFSAADAYDLLTVDDIHDAALWEKFQFRADAEGSLPGWRYVVRKPGKVELAMTLCGGCHEGEVNGRTIPGAPNKALINAVWAFAARARLRHARNYEAAARQFVDRQFAMFSVPWLKPDPAEPVSKMAASQALSAYEALPAGVVARTGTSLFFPPRIPSLIGVKDRQYLGATGLYRHQGIADLMRYAILETGLHEYSRYGDFAPGGDLPNPESLTRLSDGQLYALATYIYSLRPPPNPNRVDKIAKRGQQIFEREGCAGCHPPPLFTNNKLAPADTIGTDPRLTFETRRGTGYYTVPSLKGVWYREPIGHGGGVPTLAEWFDPVRLKDTYQENRPVKGHAFGLTLSFDDRVALLAFLNSL